MVCIMWLHSEVYIQLILFEWMHLLQVIHTVLNEFLVVDDAGPEASHCGGSVNGERSGSEQLCECLAASWDQPTTSSGFTVSQLLTLGKG